MCSSPFPVEGRIVLAAGPTHFVEFYALECGHHFQGPFHASTHIDVVGHTAIESLDVVSDFDEVGVDDFRTPFKQLHFIIDDAVIIAHHLTEPLVFVQLLGIPFGLVCHDIEQMSVLIVEAKDVQTVFLHMADGVTAIHVHISIGAIDYLVGVWLSSDGNENEFVFLAFVHGVHGYASFGLIGGREHDRTIMPMSAFRNLSMQGTHGAEE